MPSSFKLLAILLLELQIKLLMTSPVPSLKDYWAKRLHYFFLGVSERDWFSCWDRCVYMSSMAFDMSKDEAFASLVILKLFMEATTPATGADWRNRISLLNFWTWETFLGDWSTRKFVTAANTFDYWVSGLPYFILRFISLPPFWDFNMEESISCSAELHFVVELFIIWLFQFRPVYVSSVQSIPAGNSSLCFY